MSRYVDFSGGGFLSTASALEGNITATANTAWPAANLAIFVPFRVSIPQVVRKLVTGSGPTASGNFDIGIYDLFGNLIVSSGATAKGASVEHVIDVTDTPIGPGIYYFAQSADGTDSYRMITPPGTSPVPLQRARLYGTLEMATAYPLPAVATFAARTTVAIPAICAYLREY